MEFKTTDQIKPYDKNAKLHPNWQIEKIATSIKQFGCKQPIVIDTNGVIVVGHGRFEAMTTKLGYTQLEEKGQTKKGECVIPYILADDLDETEIKAYRLADNQLNSITGIDDKIVLEELKELQLQNFDVTITGFTLDILNEVTEKDDVIPDVPEDAKTILGDFYQIGNHRILCGSSTNENDVARLMDGKNAELLFTSPPYSDMRDYEGEQNLTVEHLANFINLFFPFVNFQMVNLGIQRKDGELFEYWNTYIEKARAVGYKLLSWNVWQQDGAGSIGKQTAFFPIEHEWIFVFGKFFKDINRTEARLSNKKTRRSTHRNKDGSLEFNSVGTQDTFKEMGSVLYVPSEKTEIRSKHPATFPVELAEKNIMAMTAETDIVVEPFLGSGSTLIACEKLKRNCYAMELNPKYVDVSIQRIVDFTGNKNIIKNGQEIVWE